MDILTRITKGSGPHAGRIEFYWNGKWHFYRWASKREVLKPATRYAQKNALKRNITTRSSS